MDTHILKLLITEQHESVMKLLESIIKKVDLINNNKNILDGDELIDNQDLCILFGVTKRTLQRWRAKNLLPFYVISGKTYYRKNEVASFLETYKKKKD